MNNRGRISAARVGIGLEARVLRELWIVAGKRKCRCTRGVELGWELNMEKERLQGLLVANLETLTTRILVRLILTL